MSLRSDTAAVWPGGRLRLRAKVVSESARASAAKRAVLKVRRGRQVAPGGHDAPARRPLPVPAAARHAHGAAVRRFGGLRVKRGARVLRLRAYVKGAGRSNIVRFASSVAAAPCAVAQFAGDARLARSVTRYAARSARGAGARAASHAREERTRAHGA